MNLSVSTISIQVDPIFSSTSNEDYTHPLAPLPFPTEKGTPKKKVWNPSLGSLKFGWSFFGGAIGWADKEKYLGSLRIIGGNPQAENDDKQF